MDENITTAALIEQNLGKDEVGKEEMGMGKEELSKEEVQIDYHERTKHHFHRYAAALGLDWATQPDPFRRYLGADLVRLPLPEAGRALPYWQLYTHTTASTMPVPEPLSLASISLFFRYALSLTAWKQAGETTWPLRTNPSSGNLHPTEGYVLLPAIDQVGDSAAVYHYAPKEHALERRAVLGAKRWAQLTESFPEGSFFVGLSSVQWREAWKYGERAFRYCQHDVGHALAALRIGAAALGWSMELIDGVADSTLSNLLGLDRDEDFAAAEREEAELLVLITPISVTPFNTAYKSLTAHPNSLIWQGKANALSLDHAVAWPVVDEVAQATRQGERAPINEDFSNFPLQESLFPAPIRNSFLTAEMAILGRRSAVAMDGTTTISRATFFGMLARLMPTEERQTMPWDLIPWRPRIHLGLFVHRVDGLVPGVYALVRDPAKVDLLKDVMHSQFGWNKVPGCPPQLPLYLLQQGDCQKLAATVSCGQEIAGDGAFSLAMIAQYTDSLATYGSGFYRNLFWEAGMVGQVLYLEAEEAGIRATGIGCYFDDPVRTVFGIDSTKWQSLYHFTVGGPIEDSRLTTLPAYSLKAPQ